MTVVHPSVTGSPQKEPEKPHAASRAGLLQTQDDQARTGPAELQWFRGEQLSGLTPRQTFSATQCGLLEVPTFRNMMRSRQGTCLAAAECLLLALSGRANRADERPL